MILAWLTGRRTVTVPCTVDLEHTTDSFHAYVDLDGFDVGPGDQVLVHDAPTDIGFGERMVYERHATVVQAGWLERLWTRLHARLELTELYEVSFSSWRRP